MINHQTDSVKCSISGWSINWFSYHCDFQQSVFWCLLPSIHPFSLHFYLFPFFAFSPVLLHNKTIVLNLVDWLNSHKTFYETIQRCSRFCKVWHEKIWGKISSTWHCLGRYATLPRTSWTLITEQQMSKHIQNSLLYVTPFHWKRCIYTVTIKYDSQPMFGLL